MKLNLNKGGNIMNRGKWYLVYSLNDTFGGGLGGTWEDKEILLKATTEDEAIAKAKRA